MKESKKEGRKICPECGAHRIMRFPWDNTCSVCGNSLASVPAVEKRRGSLKHSTANTN